METQWGFNNLGIDLFVVFYNIWLYHRIGISKDTKLNQIALSAVNVLLLRQIILWTLPMILFNAEQTNMTIPMILQIVFFYVVQELYMHQIHRIMHKVKFIYSYVHSWHHTVKAEDFSTAFYMHPLEIIFFIYPNLMLGPFILYCYLGFLYKESMIIWTGLATFYFIFSHTGVESDYLPSTRHHWLHHKYLVGNFGSWLSDTLFGTVIIENKQQKTENKEDIENEI
jgi:sterol desaturase/sphingolipid hydroxylase (fatty acid hydroxylase superfamily)